MTSNSYPDLKIRVATHADLPRIVPVVNAAFAVETFLGGQRTDEEDITQMIEEGQFLVAEDAVRQIMASVYAEANGERGYFGMLAVNPGHQGKGLGRLMIKIAEDHCRHSGCTFMEISVLSLRTELLPLYHKLGYIESRTEEFRTSRTLAQECHQIIMVKRL